MYCPAPGYYPLLSLCDCTTRHATAEKKAKRRCENHWQEVRFVARRG